MSPLGTVTRAVRTLEESESWVIRTINMIARCAPPMMRIGELVSLQPEGRGPLPRETIARVREAYRRAAAAGRGPVDLRAIAREAGLSYSAACNHTRDLRKRPGRQQQPRKHALRS
jgi:hypothetical protein